MPCGTGRFWKRFARAGVNDLIAADASPAMLEVAAEQRLGAGLPRSQGARVQRRGRRTSDDPRAWAGRSSNASAITTVDRLGGCSAARQGAQRGFTATSIPQVIEVC